MVEFDSALLGYIEGGGLMIRGTKGAMRLHRSGFVVYNEMPRYSEGFELQDPILEVNSTHDGGLDHMKNFLDCVRVAQYPERLGRNRRRRGARRARGQPRHARQRRLVGRRRALITPGLRRAGRSRKRKPDAPCDRFKIRPGLAHVGARIS